jgi:hypothetical protein
MQIYYKLPVDSIHVEEHRWDLHQTIQKEIQMHISTHSTGCKEKAIVCEAIHKPLTESKYRHAQISCTCDVQHTHVKVCVQFVERNI